MELPDRVTIVEVGPLDGLRHEAGTVPAAVRIGFIDRLSRTGLEVVEAASFDPAESAQGSVDAGEILAGLSRVPGVRYPVLVTDDTGLDRAVAAGAKEIAVSASASEPSSERDLGCPIDDRLQRLRAVVRRARREGCRVRGHVSMVAGCPYQGEVPPEDVVRVTTELFELGCDEVSLGDTIGVGTPLQIQDLIGRLSRTVLLDRLAVQLRDTYGQGLANTLAAFEAGVSTADTSAGGLGGAPFPAGATGAAGVDHLGARVVAAVAAARRGTAA